MGEYQKGFEVGLAAGRSAAEVTEWKPIETAPKDSTEVWLGKAAEDPRGRRVTVGYWHGKQGWQGPDDTGLGGSLPTGSRIIYQNRRLITTLEQSSRVPGQW